RQPAAARTSVQLKDEPTLRRQLDLQRASRRELDLAAREAGCLVAVGDQGATLYSGPEGLSLQGDRARFRAGIDPAHEPLASTLACEHREASGIAVDEA